MSEDGETPFAKLSPRSWCPLQTHTELSATTRETATVHILDDDPEVCEALGSLVLTGTGYLCVEHHSAEAFLASYDPAAPSCLVLDVVLPGMSGLELLRELQLRGASLPTLVISADVEVERIVVAMQRGAVGFQRKPPEPRRFLDYVRGIAQLAEVAARRRSATRRVLDSVRSLTPREQEVFSLLLQGRSAKQVAHDLGMKTRTALIHRMNVLRKFNLESVVDLVNMVRHVPDLQERAGPVTHCSWEAPD